jgi:hypothetical protein
MTRAQLPILFGAMLEEASAEERAMMLGKQPLYVRVLLRTVGQRAYARYVSRVRGG